MSINGRFLLAEDAEIQRLLSAPDEIVDFLDERDERDERDGRGDERALSIDKAWYALHWLLTGTAEAAEPPLNFIIAGGAEIGDVDVGYGAARAFTSDQVREIQQTLAALPTHELLSRYDGPAMHDLYPEGWDRPERRQQDLAFLASHYEALTAFVARAADRGSGLIAYAD